MHVIKVRHVKCVKCVHIIGYACNMSYESVKYVLNVATNVLDTTCLLYEL